MLDALSSSYGCSVCALVGLKSWFKAGSVSFAGCGDRVVQRVSQRWLVEFVRVLGRAVDALYSLAHDESRMSLMYNGPVCDPSTAPAPSTVHDPSNPDAYTNAVGCQYAAARVVLDAVTLAGSQLLVGKCRCGLYFDWHA